MCPTVDNTALGAACGVGQGNISGAVVVFRSTAKDFVEGDRVEVGTVGNQIVNFGVICDGATFKHCRKGRVFGVLPVIVKELRIERVAQISTCHK